MADDPYHFGQIAAANALSDVYAMGGRPLLALNIVCFPTCLSMDILGEILKGGGEKVLEAGAITAGGHSIDDKEPKYGLCVTGIVKPDNVLTNRGAKEGDILILTKAVGSGIINTAAKGDIAKKAHVDEAISVMERLNKYAAEIAASYKVNACTDITGFGLAGHAYEMAEGSSVSIHIMSDEVKLIVGTKEYASLGLIPAGTYRNKSHIKDKYSSFINDAAIEDIMFDPQTSGGLLYSLGEKDGMKLYDEMISKGIDCSIAGYVTERSEKLLILE